MKALGLPKVTAPGPLLADQLTVKGPGALVTAAASCRMSFVLFNQTSEAAGLVMASAKGIIQTSESLTWVAPF